MLAITRLRTFVLSRKKSAPPSYLAPRSIKSKCALLYGCNVMRNTWLVAVGCDSTAHLTSRPRGWLASILATLCVRVHPLSSCASAWPRETECVRRAECTRAARVAPSTMQIRAVTEKRIQTWMLERRWMVAVENSENALLVENDMRDNKQQRDSRCATWRKFLETKLYKFRFLFFSSTFIQDGGEKWFRFSRGKAGFHR